jgi:hypothetical protein
MSDKQQLVEALTGVAAALDNALDAVYEAQQRWEAIEADGFDGNDGGEFGLEVSHIDDNLLDLIRSVAGMIADANQS